VWADYSPSTDKKIKTSAGSRYARDFFIYSLEWTSEKLIWKINGEEFFRQTGDIPQVPMYVILSGGTEKPISGMTTMEIDWVRIYQFS
jgi:beta-glucanase (GH16 family)